MTKYSRNADDNIYTENRYEKPKETFKQIAKLLNLESQENWNSKKSLLDIGCATGEFLYYVRKLNPHITLKGVEYSNKLIDISKVFLNDFGVSVQHGDANNLSLFENETFDFVTTIGVTSIFDDFKPSYAEMIRIGKSGAKCVNHMLVNELDIDVLIKYRAQNNQDFESGWNKFSIKSIKDYLDVQNKVCNVRFIKHEMPFDIPQQVDIMRSWTVLNSNGRRVLWNGLNMEISLYHIYFEIK